jgi:hypothetical protein
LGITPAHKTVSGKRGRELKHLILATLYQRSSF